MGDEIRRLCTICARGGSKGVKNKNLRMLAGKPLIALSVEQALASEVFEGIAVSSDSSEILDAAMDAGATWRVERPLDLATDSADKSPAIMHCGEIAQEQSGIRFDTFVDLDATAPLRTKLNIKEAVNLLESGDVSNVFSVCPSRRNPYFNMVEVDSAGVPHLSKKVDPAPVSRQDVPLVYDMNASIYVWRRREFFEQCAPILTNKSRIYLMPEFTAFDLDSEFDFQMIEFIYPNIDNLIGS